jgi:hypothetical protein
MKNFIAILNYFFFL